MRYRTVFDEEAGVNDQNEARSWVKRQLRFQRLMEELRTPVPSTSQNGACPPVSD